MKEERRIDPWILFGSSLGSVLVLGLFIYSDEELRERAHKQLSLCLNTTGRLLSSYRNVVDKIVASHTSKQSVSEGIDSQWATVARRRNNTTE